MKYLFAVIFFASAGAFATCVDFSGSWEGTCDQTPGSSFAYSVNIEQSGCTKISENNSTNVIGALMQKSISDARSVAHSTQSTWASGDQTLMWTSAASVYNPGNSNERWSHQGYGTYSISNNQFRLISNYRTSNIVSGDFTVTTVEYDCTLDRAEKKGGSPGKLFKNTGAMNPGMFR